DRITASIAGAAENAGTADAAADSGAWFGEGLQNASLKLPETTTQSKSNAEVIAALVSIRQAGNQTEMHIESTSTGKIINGLKTNLPKWEDRGWIGVPERQPMQALVAALRGRTAPTTFAAVKESEGQTEAITLARAGIEKPVPDAVDLRIPARTQPRGAKLSTLTQAAAYKGIRELKKRTTRKKTEENVQTTQKAVKELWKRNPTPAQIWKSIQSRDISRLVRNFLWKTLHGSHRIGKFWLHSFRFFLMHCGVLETMEHILTKYTRPGQAEIWALAKELWTLKHPTWPVLSFGSILGLGLATFKNEEGKPLPHTARLYRILISESMYLIWKIRCEVFIAEAGVAKSATEIHNRWV
ncbi:ribonuclease H-like protein, partial [Mycena metata]